MKGLTGAADLIDRSVRGRVLLFGEPPPDGRDLDLLVAPHEERLIAARLAEEGFTRNGATWARFADGDADIVEVVPVGSWGLTGPHRDAVFREARPLAGFRHIVVPAPHHQLLIAARILEPAGRLKARQVTRLQNALRDDPLMWEKARKAAAAWNAEAALQRLAASMQGRPRRDVARTVAGLLRRPRRAGVVALCGIDGAGKSTQALALTRALDRLGYGVVTQWSPLGQQAWLEVIARPVKRMVALVPGLPPQMASRGGTAGRPAQAGDAGRRLRQRSRVVTAIWTTVVSLANVCAHGRAVRHLAAGRVVVFDRYVLDSFVRLRVMYGEHRRFRLQRLLIRLLSPRPCAAFYLDVDPETSLARKDDVWSAENLALQARIYREEYEKLGVCRLDGRRPVDELATEIVQATWRSLR